MSGGFVSYHGSLQENYLGSAERGGKRNGNADNSPAISGLTAHKLCEAGLTFLICNMGVSLPLVIVIIKGMICKVHAAHARCSVTQEIVTSATSTTSTTGNV